MVGYGSFLNFELINMTIEGAGSICTFRRFLMHCNSSLISLLIGNENLEFSQDIQQHIRSNGIMRQRS